MASSEEKDLQKKVQQSAAGADVHEGGAKAEKFQKFLKENDINFFESQTLADEFHTTIFRSRIEAKGQIMPMAIFIDDSIFTIIRTQVATGINAKNIERIKDHLNVLNAEYKIFKYYLREDGNIYLDICVPFVDETFDSRMIQTLLPILVQQLETVYEDLMAVVWAKE
ncbi:hypothetical protein [Selenomonas artemidis]|jgi:hypothetical protein|uniref:hypothetical protein n=1 Tax=Selenomonas artemidis TaxID=671224 RepID=UPI0003FBFEFD|nr:hypothetical protein [Selenomonas artemidis]